MHVFVINDKVILNILNALTLENKTKDLIKDIILRFDYSFINYIFSVFSMYTTYYHSIADENSSLSVREVNEIHSKFKDFNIDASVKNILIADVYDIMYSTPDLERTKFKHFFYEDMFNRLSNLINSDRSDLNTEIIFEALEHIFNEVEGTIVFGLIQSENLTSDDVVVYTEINNNCLMFYIL